MENFGCKKCGSLEKTKAGFVRGSQRYRCLKCHSRYLPEKYFETTKSCKQSYAVELYLEGLSIRGIGRFLEVSHVTVIRWLKKTAKILKPPLPLYAKNIEIDELYFYLGNKKRKRWLWLAICRESKRILSFQIGNRSKEVLTQLFTKLQFIQCERYYTDNHGAFRSVFPKSKHRIIKGQTNTIEGINSSIRHYLARFRRRSKCYSKSQAMVESSLYLLMYKFDNFYYLSDNQKSAA